MQKTFPDLCFEISPHRNYYIDENEKEDRRYERPR
jgi:hypothetical protein